MKVLRNVAYTTSLELKINRVLMIVASTAFIVLVVLTVFQYNHRSRFNDVPAAAAPPPFDFVPPAPRSLNDCDDLFSPGTAAGGFELSPEYWSRFADFSAAVNESTHGEKIEGFTFQQPTQYKVLHYLSGRPNVRTICETGFNLGHSAFSYLTSNPRAIVHSFDLGEHEYAYKMASYMRRRFPGRFFAHFGDSTQTVPEFVRTHPDLRCDFIYVDGGHVYPVAMADLLNTAAMANVDQNVIMFDDYPTLKAFPRPFGWAWENMRRWGYVSETLRCAFENKQFQRGFVIGKVDRRPLI